MDNRSAFPKKCPLNKNDGIWSRGFASRGSVDRIFPPKAPGIARCELFRLVPCCFTPKTHRNSHRKSENATGQSRLLLVGVFVEEPIGSSMVKTDPLYGGLTSYPGKSRYLEWGAYLKTIKQDPGNWVFSAKMMEPGRLYYNPSKAGRFVLPRC